MASAFKFAALFFLLYGSWRWSAVSGTTSPSDMFEQWMVKYGRTYANESEKSYRLGVFTKNLDYVNAFGQAGNHSYTVGLNGFSDLTDEEFLATYTMTTGPSPSDVSYPGLNPFKYANAVAPDHINWVYKGAVTGVKNQLKCGACWAFAAVASIEGINQIATGKLLTLSEQQLIACDDNDNACSGGMPYKAFSYLSATGGITTEKNFPYDPQNILCYEREADDWDVVINVTGYGIVPTNDEKSLMKAVANQPVAVAVDAHKFRPYAGGIFDGPCGTDLDHAVTLVGYATDKHGTAFWIAKNSWGKDWGEGGYIRIRKDVAEKEGRCGLAIYASYPEI